jgi:hypothetical protein
MKIFLDDQFDTDRTSWVPEGYSGVRNFAEFMLKLEESIERGEKIEAISFDNDLGDGEKEGWEIAKWLTEVHPEIFAENPELHVHSANPSGRERIEHHLTRGLTHYRELIEAKNLPDPWGRIEKKIL